MVTKVGDLGGGLKTPGSAFKHPRMEGEKHEVLHWSGMGWGKHWRQRIGVAIARGRARLLVRAATGRALWGSGGRSGRQGEGAKRPSPLSTEWNQHSC